MSGGRRGRFAASPARPGKVRAQGAAVVIGVFLLLVGLWSVWTYEGPGPAARQGPITNVVLRGGAGMSEIASTLKRAGVIRSTSIFIAAAQITGAAKHLKAGEYNVASHASMAKILSDIRNGRVVRHFVTIPEGITSEAVMEILMKADFLTGVVPAPPEGAVLPETYEAQRGEDRAVVLQRMMDARDRLLATLWDKRRADLPYKTPDEAVTLASIVEHETAKADERPRVAAVFVNRLKMNMPLGSDPTVIYGLTGGKPLGHGLRESELHSQTPYNTYLVTGLPPTPIGNPGRASLAAALDPASTKDIYFVADGTGGHAFAATKEEHDKNVARWRIIEADRRDCAAATAKTGAAPGC